MTFYHDTTFFFSYSKALIKTLSVDKHMTLPYPIPYQFLAEKV